MKLFSKGMGVMTGNTKSGDISNVGLGKFISVEFLVMLVIGGMAWGALTTEVGALDDKITDRGTNHVEDINMIQVDQRKLSNDVILINRKLDVIENNQQHIREKMEDTGVAQQEILKILRRQNGANTWNGE